jgi:hypothetical protein
MATKPPSQKPKIEPPSTWKLHSDIGYMRCGAGPDDKLVSVADVVQWLMETKELPCGRAVDMVCGALSKGAANGAQLFLVDKGDDAKPVTQQTSFYFSPIVSFWDEQLSGSADYFGLPGAVKWMRACWGKVATPLDNSVLGSELLEPLAVRFELAHDLWGWGASGEVLPLHAVQPDADLMPKTYAELKRYHANNTRHAWNQDMRKLLVAEETRKKAAGHTAIRKTMALDFDMTGSAIGEHIRKGLNSGTKSGRGRKAV